MEIFDLPKSSVVQRVIPKKSFEGDATVKQRRLMTDLIQRIIWKNKIATKTVNLPAHGVSEIQIMWIELKKKDDVREVLNLIDKAIPYPIIFCLIFEQEVAFHTSVKHASATDENSAVIDFTFVSHWTDKITKLELKKSVAHTYEAFCKALSSFPDAPEMSLSQLVDRQRLVNKLEGEVSALKSGIRKAKQFKDKVELNQKLKLSEKELQKALSY